MGATSIHFSDLELRCHGSVCATCKAGEPQKNECSEALVDALEAFRAEAVVVWMNKFAKPETEFPGIEVLSAYRCPDHNGNTPNAAKSSQHLLGNAADIRVPGLSAARLEAIARTIPAIKGIGRSDFANYLHIDVRVIPAQWTYDVNGKSQPYAPPESA
jgi:hypothetical protein